MEQHFNLHVKKNTWEIEVTKNEWKSRNRKNIDYHTKNWDNNEVLAIWVNFCYRVYFRCYTKLSEILEIIIALENPLRYISLGIMIYLILKGMGKVFNGDYKNWVKRNLLSKKLK